MACIWVLAGTNGAGKSSIAGALLRRSGGDYFNPDEVARRLRSERPGLTSSEANAAAWSVGVRLLDAAIAERRDHFFETTLGGSTIRELLHLRGGEIAALAEPSSMPEWAKPIAAAAIRAAS